jgi:hypothetical protein
MEPLIPDGSLAVFRPPGGGAREGRVFLVQLLRADDPEGGGAFTVKRWHSDKAAAPDAEGGWRHVSIELRSANREFPPIEVRAEEDLRLVGELVRVL